tara:strand:+ start:572 stop:1807 length:1236 start_codon:yes stop_codon:yes gene_type:complete
MPRSFFGIQTSLPAKSTRNKIAGIFSARVKYAMLEGKTQPTAFKNFGEYSSLGGVFFTSLNNPNPNPSFTTDNFALPLFPNMSNIPLENEIIYVINLPSNNVQSNVNSVSFYYFQPVNIWNSSHHNAIPDPINGNDTKGAQTGDYQQVGGGTVRRVEDGGTEIPLGSTFDERLDIRNLQPYEGDIIYEGRWGQSFRFGSTVSGSIVPNPWSSSGEDGDPIMMLKNGQHEEDTEPWVPQVEDINTDASSIYLTSTQIIPIEAASTSYLSYFSPPTTTSEYNGEQIILNSGRLLLNSKSDSILLSSFNTINLNSINSVNIDSPTFIAKSDTIALGDKNASEPIILGNKFLTDFEALCRNLNSLATALQIPIGGPGIVSPPLLNITPAAVQVASSAAKMLSNIKRYKSTVTTSK